MTEEKRIEEMWGCWFGFNKENNIFTIEINDIIYTVTPKQFNEIMYTLYMFYDKIISTKVMESISNFVMSDNRPSKQNIPEKPVISENTNAALKLFEDVLKQKKDDNTGEKV